MGSGRRNFVLLLVATTVASFAGTSWFLTRVETPAATQNTPHSTILSLASQLTRCLGRNAVAAKVKDQCSAVAETLSNSLRGLPQPERNRFDLYRNSNFEVIRQRDHVILFKATCSPADLAVKTFAWALYPTDPAALPADRRALGYFNVALDFDAVGFSVNGSCLIATQLPVTAIRSFSIGQVRLSDSHWLWRIDG